MYVIHVYIEFARCKFDGVLMVPHNHKTVFFGDKPVHIKLAEIFFFEATALRIVCHLDLQCCLYIYKYKYYIFKLIKELTTIFLRHNLDLHTCRLGNGRL